jgi:hypothetical protein
MSSRGMPHDDLYVSVANALDVPVTTFGNEAAATARP